MNTEKKQPTNIFSDIFNLLFIILIIWGGWSLISGFYTNLTAKWTLITYSQLSPVKESEIDRIDRISNKEDCLRFGNSALINDNSRVKTWRCFKLPADKYNTTKDRLEFCSPELCINSK